MLEICLMVGSNVIIILSIIFYSLYNLLNFEIKKNISFINRIIKINIQKINVGKQTRYFMIDKEKIS
jgi:hypothetical protein